MKPSILLIDQHERHAERIQQGLQPTYQVVTIPEQHKAIQHYRLQQHTRPYHAVLISYLLHGATGTSITERLREHDKETPIIIMYHIPEHVKTQAEQAGANDVIQKPVDIPSLMHLLAQYERRI